MHIRAVWCPSWIQLRCRSDRVFAAWLATVYTYFFFLCMQGRAKWVHQANQGSTEKQVYLCEEKSQITCPQRSNQRVEGSRSEHYRACREDTRNVYPGHGPRSSCTDTCYWVIKKLINAIVLNPTHYIYEASV